MSELNLIMSDEPIFKVKSIPVIISQSLLICDCQRVEMFEGLECLLPRVKTLQFSLGWVLVGLYYARNRHVNWD